MREYRPLTSRVASEDRSRTHIPGCNTSGPGYFADMHLPKLLPLCCSLLFAVTATAQTPATPEKDKGKPPAKPAPKLKPLSELLPAQGLVGVWHRKSPSGDEYATFTADGRAIMRQGPGEPMQLKYTVDTSAEPWKMDLSGVLSGMDYTIFLSFDLPSDDQFRMSQAVPDKEKRPDAKALKESKLVMDRIKLAPNEGLYQVVEVFLKKMAGSWEGKDGRETVTLTFTTAGEYTMKVAQFTDKGRFSINVKKVPMTIDLLSSEGAGVKYSIVGFTDDGQLRVGSATATLAERQTAFDDTTARTYKKKDPAPAKPK